MFSRMGTVGQALVAVFVAGGAFGYAMAQENGDATVDVVRVETVGETADRPMSPAEQRRAAQSAVTEASANCAAQSQALQSAKRDKDIIRATCLDDKLGQCEANLQNMKRRQAALDDAIGAGDTGRANHESTVISVLSQKFKMLAQAANQCVGQDLFETGNTMTRTEVDLFAPEGSPAAFPPFVEWPIPFFPPPVSGIN